MLSFVGSANVDVIPQSRIPTLYAVLASLPRGARIEKQVVVHSGRFVVPDPDAEDETCKEEGAEMITVEKAPEFVMGTCVYHCHKRIVPSFSLYIHLRLSDRC